MNNYEVCISEDLVLTVASGRIQEVIVTDPLQEVTDLFHERHWGWRPTGQGGMIFSRVDVDDWYFEPITLDNPELPDKALERAHAMLERGIRVQGWIIGHEVGEAEKAKEVDVERMAKFALVATAVIIGGALAIILLPVVLLGLGLVAAQADPVLCVVLSDSEQTIVEILRWIDG